MLGAALAISGLPPIDLHGPAHYIGIMDPLCGGTRAVRLALRGDLAGAWRYNPIAIPLVAGAAGLLVRHAVGVATGRWPTAGIHRPRPVLIAGTGLAAALEVNQQLHADLLRTGSGHAGLLGPALNTLPIAVGLAWWALRRRTRRAVTGSGPGQ
jgi:hypothetical protein